jgi:hypothetical protein
MIGQPVNVAAFAAMRWWHGAGRDLEAHPVGRDGEGLLHPHLDSQTGEWHLGLEWDEPRYVRKVVVRFADAENVPDDLQVQYWRHNWPTPAPERRAGARRGWIGRDDPWNGHWVTVKADVHREGETCVFRFDPVDIPELEAGILTLMSSVPSAMRQGLRHYLWTIPETLENAEHYLASFRRTLKLRVQGATAGDPPAIADVGAYTDSAWKEETLEIRFEESGDWSGSVEVFNGYLVEVSGLAFELEDKLEGKKSWAFRGDGQGKGIQLCLLRTGCAPDSPDQTIVTVRTACRSFSLRLSDLDEGPVYIKDYGVFARLAGDPVGLEEFKGKIAGNPRPIYERVVDEPEQSYERATMEIPSLDVTKQAPFGRYLPLGVEAGRQEFALRYNGELFAAKQFLKLRGRDAARLLWPGREIHYRFATGDPPDFREPGPAAEQRVLDNWLPVVISEWLDREIVYEETAFAALLDGPMTSQWERRGSEDVVAMLRFVIRNGTHGAKRARLWLAVAPQERLEVRAGGDGASAVIASGRVVPDVPVARQWRVQPYEDENLRCTVDAGGRGRLTALPVPEEGSNAISTAVVYDVVLDGGESHTIYVTVPFVTFTERGDWDRVAGLDFDEKLADVTGYWRDYVASGGQIETPDEILNEFHRAVRTHVAISVDKDPVSGMYMVPAATYTYGVCANEACWQIRMLDQAGHHDRAEAYLQTYLDTQGAKMLDGNFSSAEGSLLGAEIDAGEVKVSHFNYNLDHGYVMECLVDHYRYTGDEEWLKRVAPKLVAACDMVIREREATRRTDEAGKPVPEYGLLPAGHLEDNPEWRHWFSVNAHAYNGMREIADVLAEIDHPEVERLEQEAAAYREDIREAARRAMVESPVVRLLDGTCVPHVPTRAGIRGREWGWFREAAYGALHLLEGSVFDPNEEEMTWVLEDLEDNLFVSRDWGRPVDLERYWFSHGGTTIQPNLTHLGIDYLRRGEIEHAIRATYNNFGISLYPDVRCFTEHPVVELGHGVGPFYKSDEANALVWLRAHLLWEEDRSLHVAKGAPRAWFAPGRSFGVRRMASFFGPLTYQVQSGRSDVTVEVEVPDRRPPEQLVVHLRRPGGQRMKAVTVNGEAHVDFDPDAEVVRIPMPSGTLVIRVDYAS